MSVEKCTCMACQEERELRTRWNRCDVCGRFISMADFDHGAVRRLKYPDSDRTSETYETLCREHAARAARLEKSMMSELPLPTTCPICNSSKEREYRADLRHHIVRFTCGTAILHSIDTMDPATRLVVLDGCKTALQQWALSERSKWEHP